MSEYYIGLLSGTSIDAVDAGLISVTENGELSLIDFVELPIPYDLQQTLRSLATADNVALATLASADIGIAELFADAAATVCDKAQIKLRDVAAIGSHGQTIRHHVEKAPRFTWQIGDPNTLYQRTSVPVVSDFRRLDVAAGGQGAPFAPLLHEKCFLQRPGCAVVNIGGIANVTLRNAQGELIGFDSGPGMCLSDALARLLCDRPYDRSGEVAANGKVIAPLLDALLQEPYFDLPSPKSTGPELFNVDWLSRFINLTQAKATDLLASVVTLTARTIAKALEATGVAIDELVVCGGGAYNEALLAELASACQGIEVKTSDAFGVSPCAVEAMLFAYLAYLNCHQQSVNLSTVTGSQGELILGARTGI